MIVLRKFGNFYSAFDNDAIILHSLFGYKLTDGKTGFPVKSLDKVINKLNELHVDYSTYDKSICVNFDDNKYNLILAESKNKVALDYKISKIEEMISKLDYNTLSKLVDIIEEFVNENRKISSN